MKQIIVHKIFGKYLFATNTICSSFLMAVGDCIEQTFRKKTSERKWPHDWQRTNNMLAVGFALGPMQHFFYKFIDQRYPSKNLKSVFKKIFIEQSVASPVYITLFFLFCGVLEKQKPHQCLDELKRKFVDIYMVDCLIWPPSQFMNFLFLNPQYRMLYVNFTTMIYDVFLSNIKYEEVLYKKKMNLLTPIVHEIEIEK